ncbi:MAG: restriction endonuclease, partial [Kiritimatiellaeota bacterium]|nr:restriction endonuclease [Kiritimatiellota bacterium]
AEEALALRLPQFVTTNHALLFDTAETVPLEKEMLTEGFSLQSKDTEIDFAMAESEIATVDIAPTSDATPKAWRLTGADNQFFQKLFKTKSPEERVEYCKGMLLPPLSQKYNVIDDDDLKEYVCDRGQGR